MERNDRHRGEGASPLVTRTGAGALVLLFVAAATALAAGAPGAPHPPRSAETTGPAATMLSGASRPSHNGVYRAEVVHAPEGWDPGAPQTWIVRVQRADGAPVPDAQIRVGAWMPDTGERARTRPWVSEHLGGGRYRVEGLRFSRDGWWNVPLEIRSPEGTDSLAFNVVLPRRGVGASPSRFTRGAS